MRRCDWLGTGRELEYLLNPKPVVEFAAEYFGKRSLYVKGTPSKFAGLMPREVLQQIAMKEPPNEVDATFRFPKARWEQRLHGPMRIFPPEAKDSPWPSCLMEAGVTLQFRDLGSHDEALQTLQEAMRLQLGYPSPLQVGAFLSGDGGETPMHFDPYAAFVLQIEGSKLWRYSRRPAVAWPPGHAFHLADGSARFITGDRKGEVEQLAPNDFDEVLLEPGDLFAWPAGTWHSAKARGQSLHLTIWTDPVNFTFAIAQLLTREFELDRNWRGVPPMLPRQLSATRDGQGLREAYREYARQRIAEVRDLFASLDPEDPRLLDAWARAVLQLKGDDESTISPPSRAIKPADRFRIRADRPVYFIPRGRDGLLLYVGDQHVAVEATSSWFLRKLIAENTFLARDAMNWTEDGRTMEWSDVESVLTSLEANAIIERCEAT